MSLCLHVIAGPDAGLRRPLDGPLLVGRGPGCDVVLSDPAVAPRHLRLTPHAADPAGAVEVAVEALDGAVAYGDVRVDAGRLTPGATLTLGGSALRVAGEPPPPAERFGEAIGRDPAMRAVFARLERVAPSDLSVLVEGETGTGKELVARAIHDHSPRRAGPFVVLDCSAMPRDLVESTLFGHERGAFTGAVARHRGLFERADGGTIFVDEIGEFEPALQPRLLRVLERRELKRVGGHETIRVDVRVVAATHRDLRAMVAEGRFREDLYFRVGVVRVRLPPLRARRADIPLLAEHCLAEHGLAEHRPGAAAAPDRRLTTAALDALSEHPWPGNVRQLCNTVRRAASLAEGPLIGVDDLMLAPDERSTPVELELRAPFKVARRVVLDRFEVAYLERLVDAHGGNISRCARAAGLTRYYLRELLKKHGLHGR